MSVAIFDTETTDRKDGEIIEAAWMLLPVVNDLMGSSDRISETFNHPIISQRFRPSKPMSYGAIAVHHILPSELEDCPPSSTFKLPDDVTMIVGHSVDFDWAAAGSPPRVKRICTHAMAQHVFPEAGGYSLVALIYYCMGATEVARELVRDAHGAYTDVRLCSILLQFILDKKPEIKTWSALWDLSEECRIPRTCPMKKYEGVLLEDLDDGFIRWCLNQDWLDPYLRIGLDRVMAKRYPETRDELDDEDTPW